MRFSAIFLCVALVGLAVGSSLHVSAQSADLAGYRSHRNDWGGFDGCSECGHSSAGKPGTIYFQNGAITTWEQIDKKAPSCRLNAVESPVVRRLVPGRKLVITGSTQNNGSVFFLWGRSAVRRGRDGRASSSARRDTKAR